MLVTNIDAASGGVQKNSRLLLRELNLLQIKTFVCVRNYYDLPTTETIDNTVYHRSPVFGSSMAVNGVLYLLDTLKWLVWNRRHFDVIHCQQMFGPAMAAAIATMFIRRPFVVRVTSVGDLGEVKAIKSMRFSSIRMRLIRRVSKWIALSAEMKIEIESLGIPSDRVTIIHNATEIPVESGTEQETRSKYRRKLGLTGTHTAVFTGRLSEEKCLDVLISAWPAVISSFPEAKLFLLGEGGDFRNVEGKLRARVETLGLSASIAFLGHVDNANEYLLASDAFVLPSRTEGMSNSLVEAFACGAAIVATDIGANREICIDGENALLFPVGDEVKLAEAVINLFRNPLLAATLGRAARAFAEEDLSIEKMVSSYIEVYREVLDRSNK
jgi:glycosyltransferase involved in cell wall biosynthesis